MAFETKLLNFKISYSTHYFLCQTSLLVVTLFLFANAMGIPDVKRILWHGYGLKVRDIHKIYWKYLNGHQDFCWLDVDLNFLIYKIARGKTYLETIGLVSLHLRVLAHVGNFVVTAILDNPSRSDSKQATLQRQQKRELACIDSFSCQQAALSLSNSASGSNRM